MTKKSTKNELFSPVRKVSLNELFPTFKGEANNNISHAIVVDLPDGPRIVNFCSEGYTLISNKDLLDPIEDALNSEWNIEKEVHVRDHSKFYIDYVFKDVTQSVGNHDNLNPRIRIQNSYDGSLKFQGAYGAFRQICTNGLTIGEVTKKVKMMHTLNVSSAASDIIKSAAEYMKSFEELLTPYKTLKKKTFSIGELPDMVKGIMDSTSFPVKQEEAVLARFEEERKLMGDKPNMWLLYNAFNYQLNHNEAIGMKEHKKDKLDGEILQEILAA